MKKSKIAYTIALRVSALLVITVLLWCCRGTKSLNQQNFSSLYTKNEVRINPTFSVYHVDENHTEVKINISTSKLQYATGLSPKAPVARLKINYQLFHSFDDAVPLDSASTLLFDTLYEDVSKNLVATILFETDFGKDYVVKFNFLDLNKKTEEPSFVKLNKADIGNAQNFSVISSKSEVPSFTSHLKVNQPVRIQFNDKSKTELRVRYYNREFDLPAPPFAVYNPKSFDYQADSIFPLYQNEEGYFDFRIEKRGMYHVLSDYSQRQGLTLFHFDNHFPKVETAEDLIEPLRYITKKQEYMELVEAEHKKKAIDKFWLSISPSKDRAKKLIKEFYNRVEDANEFFTSYRPGWKTDRGIVYIIFGEPNAIYKNSGGESWIYGEEGAYLSVNFNFIQVDNPFTENDFRLNRSPIYKDAWYKAVEAWRNGRVSINP